jgi:hypothetical protein
VIFYRVKVCNDKTQLQHARGFFKSVFSQKNCLGSVSGCAVPSSGITFIHNSAKFCQLYICIIHEDLDGNLLCILLGLMPGPGSAQHSDSTTCAVTFSSVTMHEHARITTCVVLVNCVMRGACNHIPVTSNDIEHYSLQT